MKKVFILSISTLLIFSVNVQAKKENPLDTKKWKKKIVLIDKPRYNNKVIASIKIPNDWKFKYSEKKDQWKNGRCISK